MVCCGRDYTHSIFLKPRFFSVFALFQGRAMFARMTKICRLIGLALLSLAACKDSSDGPFISLAELCQVRSELLCDAIANCCNPPPEGNCLIAQKAACEAERAELVQNSRRSYDSEVASQRLDEQRAQTPSCGEVLPLSRYFGGGEAEGGSCGSDDDCASGTCDSDTGLCSQQSRDVGGYCQMETQ